MKTFLIVSMIILMILILAAMIRAILGPRIADRIMAINMIGSMTIAVIAILSFYLGESSLLDICLIYAAISFVAVIVISKIYIGIYREKKQREEA
ncbi:MAG: sodium:proton antiporter [Lachnospiraceae bacterium]|nr:sodium:proton antiporter [Lachnospiraceae bacterium]